MTIAEVINRVRAIKSPCPPEADLIKVISDTEHDLYRHVISPREEDLFEGYTAADMNTPLAARAPFDNIYVIACLKYIDRTENQITNYNNNEREYKELVEDFAAWYIRTHRPKSGPRVGSRWYGV